MTGELASRDLCVPVYMKKKKQTTVSVQTSTNVTRNPLAISMVTTKPTVQRLKRMKRRVKSRRESKRLSEREIDRKKRFKRAGVVQV